MQQGRARAEWDRTAAILEKVHNVNATDESSLTTAENENPYRRKPPEDPDDADEVYERTKPVDFVISDFGPLNALLGAG